MKIRKEDLKEIITEVIAEEASSKQIKRVSQIVGGQKGMIALAGEIEDQAEELQKIGAITSAKSFKGLAKRIAADYRRVKNDDYWKK